MNDTKKEQRPSVLELTWRDTDKLRRFVTETGKILPRRKTRLTAHEQRTAIKGVGLPSGLRRLPVKF